MKNKLTLFFFTAFISYNVFSQENYIAKYEIVYTKSKFEHLDNKKRTHLNKKIKEALLKNEEETLKLSKRVNFTLKFNKNLSVFNIDNFLELEGTKAYKMFLINIGYKGTYYSKFSRTTHLKNSYGQNFIIDIPKYKWNITNQEKEIRGFKCFKATTIKLVESSKGVYKVPITAWFSVNIPFNYGPKEFNNLPGLILELHEGKTVFKLKSLKKVKKLKIKEQLKGKKISLKEFDELSKKMYENRGN